MIRRSATSDHSQLRDQTDFDRLTAALGEVVQETLHPVGLGIWVSHRS
jgi:hypothetical protein